MKIEEGKYYRTRDGRKALAYANKGDVKYPFFYTSEHFAHHAIKPDGKSFSKCEENDLISEWHDITTPVSDKAASMMSSKFYGNSDMVPDAQRIRPGYVQHEDGTLHFVSPSEPVSDSIDADDGMYSPLRAILDDAYAQAESGKGKERHANDRPFLSQPICEIGRMLGSVCDGELYQAIKKAQEASNMLARGENKRAEAELLGAINYLAAAVILIRENMNDA